MIPTVFLRAAATVLAAWCFGLIWQTPQAAAHPVSQGSMEVTIHPERIELRARVSTEEVFVRRAFAPMEAIAAMPADLDAMWQDHGRYLLGHVRVFADGKPLAGRLTQVVAPPADTPANAGGDRLICHFEYPLDPASPPRVVRLEEDVLNEFTYAPGNRWEASYVVRIGQAGRVFSIGRLLTSKDPLEFPCDWSPLDAKAPPMPGREHAELSRWQLIRDYVHHGVMHILTGYDHLLFITALALATITFWDLVKVISAFTLAHTVTLTLSTLNVVRLPERIVEPMIAASIVFVAMQNVFWPRQSRGASRLGIAFFFGLFHGLGFAGGLLEAMEGLPGVAVAVAIVAFSLGVELGHQAVVLPVFFGLRWARSARSDAAAQAGVSRLAMRYGSALIVLAGSYYLMASLRS
jgi:hydrogenase/urease accessory protein HupE